MAVTCEHLFRPKYPERVSDKRDPTQTGTHKPDNTDIAGQRGVGMGDLVVSILLYTVARLLLVVVVAAIIMGIGALAGVTVPLLVAAVFGVLIALPLGMVLFKKLRVRVNTQIAAVDSERRRKHEDLQTRLRGADGKRRTPSSPRAASIIAATDAGPPTRCD